VLLFYHFAGRFLVRDAAGEVISLLVLYVGSNIRDLSKALGPSGNGFDGSSFHSTLLGAGELTSPIVCILAVRRSEPIPDNGGRSNGDDGDLPLFGGGGGNGAGGAIAGAGEFKLVLAGVIGGGDIAGICGAFGFA
jgi:hypothetical protein